MFVNPLVQNHKFSQYFRIIIYCSYQIYHCQPCTSFLNNYIYSRSPNFFYSRLYSNYATSRNGIGVQASGISTKESEVVPDSCGHHTLLCFGSQRNKTRITSLTTSSAEVLPRVKGRQCSGTWLSSQAPENATNQQHPAPSQELLLKIFKYEYSEYTKTYQRIVAHLRFVSFGSHAFYFLISLFIEDFKYFLLLCPYHGSASLGYFQINYLYLLLSAFSHFQALCVCADFLRITSPPISWKNALVDVTTLWRLSAFTKNLRSSVADVLFCPDITFFYGLFIELHA